MGILDRVAVGVRFFRKGLEDFDTTANVVSSSRWLVEEMLAKIPPDAKVVVEFGPGTGTLTRQILAKLGPDAKLYAIELEKGLLEGCVRAIDDRRLVGVHGSAADAATLLDASVVGHADAVISSLGLSLMDEPIRESIMVAARALLAPGAAFTQYAYVHARYVAYSQQRRAFFTWDARPFVRRLWPRVDETMVWKNVPPAVVFTCRG
ncbi:MAG: methyltransferase domain-containing protein [Myxococcales bacterium]|nr:methyltransferase domain-containing protein [Myxococcales bacterium]